MSFHEVNFIRAPVVFRLLRNFIIEIDGVVMYGTLGYLFENFPASYSNFQRVSCVVADDAVEVSLISALQFLFEQF